MMRRPTSVEPVNAVLSTSGFDASSSPTVPPGPAIDVDHARRDVGLLEDLAEHQGGDRGEGGRLDDRAVAGGEGRADLPRRHDQREVPRDHAGGDAVGLVLDEVGRRRERRPFELDLVGLLLGQAGEPLEGALGAGHVGERGLLDGAAAVAGLHLGELVGLGAEQLGDLVELGPPLLAAHLGPRAFVEGLAGRLDGPDRILLAGLGHVADLGSLVAGSCGRERLAAGGVDVLAVDEQLVVGHGRCPLVRVPASGGARATLPVGEAIQVVWRRRRGPRRRPGRPGRACAGAPRPSAPPPGAAPRARRRRCR